MSNNEYFEKILPEEDPKKRKSSVALLSAVLERRLPTSCFIYNQIVAYQKRVRDEFTFYIFRSTENASDDAASDEHDDADNRLWILSTFMREDCGHVVSISPPTSSFKSASILPSVEFALKKSNYIEWNKPYFFLADAYVSDMLIKFMIRDIGNLIKIIPVYLFAMEPEYALSLDLSSAAGKPIQLAPLDPEQGTEFICRHWPFTRERTDEFMRKCLKRDITGGIVVPAEGKVENGGEDQGELVCAAILPGYGLLSSLATHPNHRRKGYASLVTKFVFKQMAEQGYYPCLDAEISDPNAVGFHKSVKGNTIVSKIDYICHKTL